MTFSTLRRALWNARYTDADRERRRAKQIGDQVATRLIPWPKLVLIRWWAIISVWLSMRKPA